MKKKVQLTSVDVTHVRMSVALARHAAREGSAVGDVATEARGARLTELTHVAVWACALLHPCCLLTPVETLLCRA
jgi:hypothetical protein